MARTIDIPLDLVGVPDEDFACASGPYLISIGESAALEPVDVSDGKLAYLPDDLMSSDSAMVQKYLGKFSCSMCPPLRFALSAPLCLRT